MHILNRWIDDVNSQSHHPDTTNRGSHDGTDVGSLEKTTDFKVEMATDHGGPKNAETPNRPDACGRYRLDELLGQGGFAEVWQAFDPQLKRVVAVKIPRASRAHETDLVQRFIAEGQKAAALNCPEVVQVYDVGTEADCPYIVSEFKDGGTLGELLERERPSIEETVRILARVADGLHQAHLTGMVHRDVKPENILLDGAGQPFLADFGLATTEWEQLDEHASFVGSIAYMSPEQMLGDNHRVDARTDIYSLGVCLYRMLTGRLPYVAKSVAEYSDQILYREPRPPRTIDDSIPESLEAICLKCMSKDIFQRYSTATDVASQLRAALDDTFPQPRAANRRSTKTVGMIAGVTAAIGMIVAVVAIQAQRGNTLTAEPRLQEQVGNQDQQPPAAVPPDRKKLLLPDPLRGLPELPLQEVKWRSADVATWEVPEQKNIVRVVADDLLVLTSGVHQKGDTEFSVILKPQSNVCQAGIFFGYHSVDALSFVNLQTFGVTLNGEDRNRRLDSSLRWFPLEGATGNSRWEFVSVELIDARAESYRLAVHLRDGRLVSVVPDNKSDSLIPRRAAGIDEFTRTNPGWPIEGHGAFGLWCATGSVIFSQPLLNNKPVRFTTENDSAPVPDDN